MVDNIQKENSYLLERIIDEFQDFDKITRSDFKNRLYNLRLKTNEIDKLYKKHNTKYFDTIQRTMHLNKKEVQYILECLKENGLVEYDLRYIYFI